VGRLYSIKAIGPISHKGGVDLRKTKFDINSSNGLEGKSGSVNMGKVH
jgi:hypothetical protein